MLLTAAENTHVASDIDEQERNMKVWRDEILRPPDHYLFPPSLLNVPTAQRRGNSQKSLTNWTPM